jgi:hypothetical protein
MSYKPQDFLVGVIDLFAVLLPGAILVGVALGVEPVRTFLYSDPDGILRPLPAGAPGWVAFVLAAYLAGHLLFLVGALLDSALYDPLRRMFVPPTNDKAFNAAKAAQAKLSIAKAGINPFQWARASLRLHAPAALAEVERFEADSKFFRGVVVALYALFLMFAASRAALLLAFTLPVGLLLLQVPPALRPGEEARDASRKAWSKVIVAFFLGVLLTMLLATALAGDWRGLFLLVLLGLCTWRYAERRWKSTRTAYQYAVILDAAGWKVAAK